MGRLENILIFKDTEFLCCNNEILENATSRSIAFQKVIKEKQKIKVNKNRYNEKANVIVSQKKTFQAAKFYKHCKVAVHNFASTYSPGGGVANGAMAQEESLCQCSNLYFCLNSAEPWKKFYLPHHKKLHNTVYNDDIIYTPNIMVFKTDDMIPKLMNQEDWYTTDVITCAAPNLKGIKITDSQLLFIHEKRLRRILDVAVLNNIDTIILGAFGCGAFHNNPQIVANAAKNVLTEYMYAFKNIEFAIFCNPNNDLNYRIFKNTIS